MRTGIISWLVVTPNYPNGSWKAGVMLNDLQNAKTAPVQMLSSHDLVRSVRLMGVMDSLNGRFGRRMVRPAVSGVERRWTAGGASIAALHDAAR